MAAADDDVTVTVGAEGNETTMADGMATLITSFGDYASSYVATLQYIDSGELVHGTTVDLGGIGGTPSISTFLRVESTQHTGVIGSGARIKKDASGSNGHAFTISDAFVHVRQLQVSLSAGADSNECFRLNDTNAFFEKCTMENRLISGSQCDAIYTPNAVNRIVHIADCGFGKCTRAVVHLQQTSGSSTQIARIVHSTFLIADGTYALRPAQGGSNTTEMYCYNIVVDGTAGDEYSDTYTGVSWTGQGNTSRDDTGGGSAAHVLGATNNKAASVAASGDDITVTNVTQGSLDFQILDDGQAAFDYGQDPSTDWVDTRWDNTVDLYGNARSGTWTSRTSGCSELVVAGGATPKGVFGLPLSGPFRGALA